MVLRGDDYGTLKCDDRHTSPPGRQRHVCIICISGSRTFQDFRQAARGWDVTKRAKLGCTPFGMASYVDEEQGNDFASRTRRKLLKIAHESNMRHFYPLIS